MKKIFTLFILSAFSFSLMANIVDREEARNRAVQFLNSSNPVKAKARSRQVKNIDLRYVDAGFDHLYVFNNGTNGGFVVVSADDRTESVLAYGGLCGNNAGAANVTCIMSAPSMMLQEERLSSCSMGYISYC